SATIFGSTAAIRSFENPISTRRSLAASGSRPLRITKSSMNHLSLRDVLSQAGVVAAHLSAVTFAPTSPPRKSIGHRARLEQARSPTEEENHEAARVHHIARRCSSGMAARGARAAGQKPDQNWYAAVRFPIQPL